MLNNRLLKLPVQIVNTEHVDMGMEEENIESYESYIYVFADSVRAFGPAGPPNEETKSILYFDGESDGWVIQMPVTQLVKLFTDTPHKLS